jgi:trimethylamine--corrinoid protein Co-methyltransferase
MKRNIKTGKRYGRGLEFNVFTEDELNDIHCATLEVLRKTGVFVEDEAALDIFSSGGAKVDAKTKVVRIPPHLVEGAVRSAPEVVLLAGRNPENDILLEMNRVGFDCFGEAIQIIDAQTRKIREPKKADLADATMCLPLYRRFTMRRPCF